MNAHRSSENNKSSFYIARAIRKYGFDNFKVTILDDTATDDKSLNALEVAYISQLDSMNHDIGYNMTAGGDGLSSEFMKKAWTSGVYDSKEYRQKLSKAFTGRPSVRKRAVRIIETGLEFESLSKCAEFIKGFQSNICSVLTGNGKLRSYKGYTFEYI